MKHKFMTLISAALMLIFITLTSSCAVYTAPKSKPQQKHRHVWVNEVYYEQVYYVDKSHNTVIVSQTEVPKPKHKKPHRNNGHKK